MHRQDTLNEATAFFGMGAVAGFAAEHAVAHCALGDVIRWLDAFDVNEGPECVHALQQLGAFLAVFR